MDTSRPSSSSSSVSNSSINTPSEQCAVCDDITVHSKQYGVFACLGCIVFFRRAIQNNNQYRCWKDGNCVVNFASRCSCRCCRLKKCFEVGMKPKSIRKRDIIGPRDPKTIVNSSVYKSIITDISLFTNIKSREFLSLNLHPLIRLQHFQHARHTTYSTPSNQINRVDDKSFARLATSNDINLVFKLGMNNANEWANQFETYRTLSRDEKSLVLSEYGIGFLLVDQAFKAHKVDELHNGTINNSYELVGRDKFLLADDLMNSLSRPFRKLQIDEFECAILKTLLLLASSFPGQIPLKNRSQWLFKCLEDLMTHLMKKYNDNGEERFGELVLLLSSVRCAVKSVYNQTKIPGIFHLSNFDPCLKNLFLN